MKKIVIIGFGAAAYAALMTFKRIGCRDEITIVDPKECDLFHPCGLPYAIEGTADALKLSQNIGLDRMGVRKIRGSLRSVDKTTRSLGIVSAEGECEIDYDTLLLAAGSVPVVPRIPGVDQYINKGIFTISSAEDLRKIEEMIASNRKCAVIGAGAIGLETAASLISRGCDVTVFEMCDSIMAGVLDLDMSSMLEETLSHRGMKIMKSSQVVAFNGEETLKRINTGDTDYDADLCIIAAGRSPSVEYLPSGIECDPRLGIVTDDAMRTTDMNIFAAGDCAVTKSSIDGKPSPVKLATSSFNQGVTAAYQIAGRDGKFRGSAGTFVSVIGGIEIAATGFNSASAAERGSDPVSVKISSSVRPDYMNVNDRITIKVIADRKTSRIIGGQAIGNGASARINIVGSGIMMNATTDDFESLEMAYCPAVSEVYDPLRRAVDGLKRRM